MIPMPYVVNADQLAGPPGSAAERSFAFETTSFGLCRGLRRPTSPAYANAAIPLSPRASSVPAGARSHARATNLHHHEISVFFAANRRANAVKWSGCDRAKAWGLKDVPRASIHVGGGGGGGRRLSGDDDDGRRRLLPADKFAHAMRVSDFCLVMCGDTPTSRAAAASCHSRDSRSRRGRFAGSRDSPARRVFPFERLARPSRNATPRAVSRRHGTPAPSRDAIGEGPRVPPRRLATR